MPQPHPPRVYAAVRAHPGGPWYWTGKWATTAHSSGRYRVMTWEFESATTPGARVWVTETGRILED